MRFPGLLYDLGLSGQRSEVLSVKLEVDTNPPAGAGLATTVVRRFVVLQLQHHDKASLLAGKLHTILQRFYTKGRDIYDLLWYLSDPAWPLPNLALLNNALAQTGWQGVSADRGELAEAGARAPPAAGLERHLGRCAPVHRAGFLFELADPGEPGTSAGGIERKSLSVGPPSQFLTYF